MNKLTVSPHLNLLAKFAFLPITIVTYVIKLVVRGYQRLMDLLRYLHDLWINEFTSLQRWYLATVLFIFPLELHSLAIFVACAVVIIEFWPKVISLWESNGGKLTLIFGYAVVMNFALASAASMVNEVSGISANYLPYTHNFAAILIMPQWIFGVTLVILILLQVWLIFTVLWQLLKKAFGTRQSRHSSAMRFPLLVTIAKTIVVGFLATSMVEMSMPTKDKAIAKFEAPGHDDSNDPPIEKHIEVLAKQLNLNFDANSDEEKSVGILAQLQKLLLLSFIYHQEADEYSRCRLSKGQRAIELNDREVLLVSKINKSFSLSVEACNSAAYPLASDSN